ncbi:DNA-packaging protein [Brevundimonas sp. 'scallop']|uniref:DNA-packaging protein n=1 Tax=Brevundimonas sp. 'scallop' TaxID=2562582 RepID=UPI0013E1F3BC|nr:terminase family protein [Brevundimonas sp. 'scallop']QIF81079.1 DNA-packaging protein [Brevundimonas sp. 'scallop']
MLKQLNGRELRLKRNHARLLEHQHKPRDLDLRTWLLLGGRGSGKTFAGSVWIDKMARKTPGVTLALVGPALHDVREVMVEGASGIKALAEPGDRPRWEAGRRRLVWKNQSAAYAFSAEDPDSLRGSQFHAAWADEFCAWRRPEMVLSNLRFGLRLGASPLLAVTTTPRPIPALRRLMAEAGTVTERAATALNAQNLSPGFLAHLNDVYGGTRLAAQELEGVVVEGEGALFRIADLKRARGARPVELDRIVVAVDPPATATGDACGIVVVGRKGRQAFVLADRTVQGRSPQSWGGAVSAAAREFGAHEVVAESNQGGDMVRSVLAISACPCRIEMVHASRSKAARAEPVALLYEQGRVVHCDAFPALEEEMLALGIEGGPSPDRADALVWAITRLMLGPQSAGPRLRGL